MSPKIANKITYPNAAAWYSAAMQRPSLCDASESQQRQALANTHNQQERITDPDILADQQLYIQGKMAQDEYQNYLLYKHTTFSNP